MIYTDYELIYMVKENEEALSLIIKKYEPLFRKLSFSFVKKYQYKGLDVEDLIQQCRIAMCYAVDKFDDKNKVLFYSYLMVCLKRAIKNYARKYINSPDIYYLDNEFELNEFASNNISEIITEKEFFEILNQFCLDLSFQDACIFKLKLGNFSYNEIAVLLDINRKRVDNVLLKIRKKLEKKLDIYC